MINWSSVIANSFWLVGLALLLAIFGFASYTNQLVSASGRQRTETPVKFGLLQRFVPAATWRLALQNNWLRTGACLFCIGMALTAGSEIEAVGWALLCLPVLYSVWTRRHVARQFDQDLSLSASAQRDSLQSTRAAIPKRIAEFVVKSELLWLALLSPLILFPRPGYVAALLVIPLLWIARRVARGHFVFRTPLDLSLLLMLLMVLVSLYATPDINLSLGGVQAILYGCALYYALLDWACGRRALRLAIWGYALSGLAIAALGLLGTDWPNKISILTPFTGQLPATLQNLAQGEGGFNANQVGVALLGVLPLQFALFLWSWRGGIGASLGSWLLRAGLAATMLVCIGSIVLMQSRNSLIGLLITTLLVLVLMVPRLRLLIIGGTILTVAAVAYVGPMAITDRLYDAGINGLNTTDWIISFRQRQEIWSRALYGIEDFSFTGMGVDTFKTIMPILYPMAPEGEGPTINHAHNEFLQAALDLGLPGLIAFLSIWMVAAGLATQAWLRQMEAWNRAALAGVIAALVAFFQHGIADAIIFAARPGLMFWVMLALLTALWLQTRPKPARLELLIADALEQTIKETASERELVAV